LESAWEQWRALHGLAVAPAQPVVSYVGYSLNEPWGEPRVVIGIDADEAEFLAEFLDRDECARRAEPGQWAEPVQQATSHQGTLLAEPSQPPDGEYTSTALLGAPIPHSGPGPLGGGPLPLGLRRPAITSADMAAELAGWQSGELPGQASEQLG
jgi:hypothetical protein